MVFSISRRKGAGRRWRERWPSKIGSHWGRHCCDCWFDQEWSSNRIKNDSRIFEHPQDCRSSDSERGFGKEKVVCKFCSTFLDTWAKGKSSHILPRHYRDGRCRQNFFLTILLREMRSDVLPMIPKQRDRVLNRLVKHLLSRRNLNSKDISFNNFNAQFLSSLTICSALIRHTVQPFTESDDTRCCDNTICPEDGHVDARNMSRI